MRREIYVDVDDRGMCGELKVSDGPALPCSHLFNLWFVIRYLQVECQDLQTDKGPYAKAAS